MKHSQEDLAFYGSKKETHRIAYLDGLRGLAILFVALFHFYYSLPTSTNVSYGQVMGHFSLIKYGYFGVMLFFVISGFVICQTLHHSRSPRLFLIKRFARLFPAMCLCSALTFLFSFFSPQIYHSTINNFLPSLTFLDPQIYNFIFRGKNFDWMDGAYWSLFTEVRFYVVAASIYFYDKLNFSRNFLIVAGMVGIVFPCAIYFEINQLRSALNYLFIANQLPWFVFGIGCYYLHRGNHRKSLLFFVISFVSLGLYLLAISKKPYIPMNAEVTLFAAILIYALLFFAIKVNIASKLLSFKPLVAIGVASYSFYLLHQEIGQKIILMLDNWQVLNGRRSYFLPLMVVIGLNLMSLLIFKYYEKPCNKKIIRFFDGEKHTIIAPVVSGSIEQDYI